jgi:hypothetical protein
MKSKTFEWTARSIAVLVVLAVSIGALAENSRHKTFLFKGVFNAYSPQTSATGPYEIRGPWSMTVNAESGKADFSAALDMELSDGWAITKNSGNFDPNARGAHTHHITLVGAEVTPIANGFQITGPANFTLNGGPAPAAIAPSSVVIQITGGSDVEFSNITLTFAAPGSNHFGGEPLPGVVRSVEEER